MRSCISAILLCTNWCGTALAQPVSDEALRLAALRAIFPGMQVSLDPGKKIDDSSPAKPVTGEASSTDALTSESVYTITGAAMNRAETCASENVLTQKLSITRQLRFRLFRWPKENNAGLLAVLQYDFPGANPALACPSLGILVHLTRTQANWIVKDSYLLETTHHFVMQGIRLPELTGLGADNLVIESDSGGAGTAESELYLFDLSRGKFDEVLETESWISAMTDDRYTQILDLDRSRENHGQQFCFTKTTIFEGGKAFAPARVTHPCYKRGDGVDPARIGERNKWLEPSH